MCISNGAPPHRKGQKVNDEVREGANALWEFLYAHNAVFMGDSGLGADLDKFLEEHGLTRNKTTEKQEGYIKVFERGLKVSPEIVG